MSGNLDRMLFLWESILISREHSNTERSLGLVHGGFIVEEDVFLGDSAVGCIWFKLSSFLLQINVYVIFF